MRSMSIALMYNQANYEASKEFNVNRKSEEIQHVFSPLVNNN